MRIRIDGLSEPDRLLEDELNRCSNAYRCFEIAQEAKDATLRLEAHKKCIRLYRQEEYSAGLL